MKRKVPAAVAKSILARVPMQVSFWLCTNENLRSLADLSAALRKADDEVFRYHVNRDKNDFEVWIRVVLKDKDLAREIARVKTKETLMRKISERVEELMGVVKRSGAKKKHKSKRLIKHRKRASRGRRTRMRARARRVAMRFAKKRAVRRRARNIRRMTLLRKGSNRAKARLNPRR